MANGWIEWEGGECPVPRDASAQFKFRDGGEGEWDLAGGMRWSHAGSGGDIVAYRLCEPAPTARDKQVAGTHYKAMGVEPWDVVDTWPREQRIGAYRHGALKYLMRMGCKDDSAQEIAKGIHYLEKLLEVLRGQ